MIVPLNVQHCLMISYDCLYELRVLEAMLRYLSKWGILTGASVGILSPYLSGLCCPEKSMNILQMRVAACFAKH